MVNESLLNVAGLLETMSLLDVNGFKSESFITLLGLLLSEHEEDNRGAAANEFVSELSSLVTRVTGHKVRLPGPPRTGDGLAAQRAANARAERRSGAAAGTAGAPGLDLSEPGDSPPSRAGAADSMAVDSGEEGGDKSAPAPVDPMDVDGEDSRQEDNPLQAEERKEEKEPSAEQPGEAKVDPKVQLQMLKRDWTYVQTAKDETFKLVSMHHQLYMGLKRMLDNIDETGLQEVVDSCMDDRGFLEFSGDEEGLDGLCCVFVRLFLNFTRFYLKIFHFLIKMRRYFPVSVKYFAKKLNKSVVGSGAAAAPLRPDVERVGVAVSVRL